MNLFDTIAAVSTPYGKGGIAVLRVSGSEALEISEKVFFPRNGKKLCEIESSKADAEKVYADYLASDGSAEAFAAFNHERIFRLLCRATQRKAAASQKNPFIICSHNPYPFTAPIMTPFTKCF